MPRLACKMARQLLSYRMADKSAGVFPLLPINRDDSVPLHRQVYAAFRDAIVRGDLAAGQQVPSSRALAAELGISRFPVLDAYAQLIVEGYFESRAGAGTYVAANVRRVSGHPETTLQSPEGIRAVSRRSRRYPAMGAIAWRYGLGPFAVHQPALDHFPYDIWSKLVARHSRNPRVQAVHNMNPMGLEPFREALCAYLRTARAVRCEPNQIMIVSGSQQALDLTTRVLLDPGDEVWIEEPSYPLLRALLLGSGCRLIPVPVDRDGMNVAAGIELAPEAHAAFVTPSHHYSLGATMSAPRRLLLIEWARQSGAWIVEDDYDSEFRYERMPIPSLQGLDPSSRVIYIGTFSKVLRPSLRIGYMVIPTDLVERFASVRYSMDIFPPYLYQEALTDFIQEGHFARHIRHMKTVYKTRRTALVKSLWAEFGDFLQILGAEAGMNMTVTLPPGYDDTLIAQRAAQEKLWLWPLSNCCTGPDIRHGFILGFSNIPEDQMPSAVRHLRQIIER